MGKSLKEAVRDIIIAWDTKEYLKPHIEILRKKLKEEN